MAENGGVLPEFLAERLKKQYGDAGFNRILSGYEARRPVTLRVNPLKASRDDVLKAFSEAGISYRAVSWYEDAFIIENAREEKLRGLSVYENGGVYLQSLSSMLPPLILEPAAREAVLDMAAAPGGKTTQMAALSGNLAQITACEKNKIRADRLGYNLKKQGASCAMVMVADARNLDEFFRFDRILLDAPCSGSGTLEVRDGILRTEISEELIARSVKTQETLLKKAFSLLKPGHEMVYSTCSILAEENERLVSRVIKSCGGQVIPIDEKRFDGLLLLENELPGTLLIGPDELYEGFFVAKLCKK